MTWDAMFGTANLWALIAWAALIALPRKPFVLSAVLYAGVGLLCLAYTALLAMLLGGVIDGGEGGASFTSIAGVRAIFSSDAGVTVGWIHYLAFDLFTGLWIARDADHKHFSRLVQAPVLVLTFLAGPAGLLIYLLMRERRARSGGRGRIR